ncbi:hypothetical protein [Demequina litorisediminis]|uniref:Small multidrug efflux protein n=1 Tax=Demequina litorisediminis TaxID=1849022 RepID=A0ABQ6IIW3_9MICO|nr:hypothetical protein [Demequina litorisediminis]GMA37245.1 hypothetical protein GCM10025876_34490 [Demequina litorisediminis]
MFNDLILNLTDFVAGLSPWLQAFGVALISLIPFVESYLGTFIGVLVGMNPWLALVAAVIGNTICTFALIAAASRTRRAVIARRQDPEAAAPSKRRQRIAGYLERFGVPGVSLLGPLALPSQFTAPTMVALGASARSVYFWMGISIVAWGVLFGFFGNWAAGVLV